MKKAFTLIELIFVIVIIGVLSAVAIPKFAHLSSNSKVAAELATASTIQSAIDDAHSEWVISEGSFNWGSQTTDCSSSSSNFNCSDGYPQQLGDDCSHVFNRILKSSATVDAKWTCVDNNTSKLRGPASKSDSGVNATDGDGKPGSGDCWKYSDTNGTFTLDEGCS